MNLTARKKGATSAPVDRHDEAELARTLTAQAASLRDGIARELADAEANATKVRAQAGMWVSEAESALRQVQGRAQSVENQASAISARAGLYAAAAGLAEQIAEAEQRARALDEERTGCMARVGDLSGRLEEHEAALQAAETALQEARAGMDADAAAHARTRLAGLQELTPELTRQRDTARVRADAIGPHDGSGELGKTLEKIITLMRQRSDLLDKAEPERVTARREADPVGFLAEYFAGNPRARADWLRSTAKQTEKVRPILGQSGDIVGHVRQP